MLALSIKDLLPAKTERLGRPFVELPAVPPYRIHAVLLNVEHPAGYGRRSLGVILKETMRALLESFSFHLAREHDSGQLIEARELGSRI